MKIIKQHDHVWSHTAHVTMGKFWWKTLLHLPYSPNLVPSDYNFLIMGSNNYKDKATRCWRTSGKQCVIVFGELEWNSTAKEFSNVEVRRSKPGRGQWIFSECKNP